MADATRRQYVRCHCNDAGNDDPRRDTFALTWFNPFVFIGLIALLAHAIQRKWGLTVFVAFSFLLILNLGYWQEETMETLAQVLFATFVCVIIGVPLGICSRRTNRCSTPSCARCWT